MSFESIDDILGGLEVQAKLQEQPFQILLTYWSEVVGKVVAAHTQPLLIQRGVLRVATSSAAWAQNLTFERQRLLLKLNEKLPTPLIDIRFSTAGWQRPKVTELSQQTVLSSKHPSFLAQDIRVDSDVTSPNQNANTAFQYWAKTVQARSHGLPLCPQCKCPTPAGELQRWRVCFICAAKHLSSNLEQ
jgi:predicted nucleic acid-binding Zn ribbon protein